MSILTSNSAAVESTLTERLSALSIEQKVRLLTGADFWSLYPEPHVGLRRLVVSDGPAGVRGETWDERDTSANVPSPTALAATWDCSRVERVGRLLAAECRRKKVDVLLAPTVNLQRSPYGGRHFEVFSEDPHLSAVVASAYVVGLQSQGVGATVKHFVANDSETDRYNADMVVDERTLREVYLAPFEVIVREAGAWAVMAAYNQTNGVTMTESPLLRDVLQGEWGFDGLTMTDWFAGRSTEAAGNGGLDLVMPGPTGPWGDALVAAVRDGRVSESAIDDKVLRLLRLAGRVGALAGVDGVAVAAPWSQGDVAQELRSVAAAGCVLVRNAPTAGTKESGRSPAPVLPLDVAHLHSVAVLGPNAAQGRTLGGGSALVFPPYTVSPLAGLTAALGSGVRVDYAPGVRAHTRLSPADVAHLRVPDGDEPGVEVNFLAADGKTLGSERRQAAAYNWHGVFGDFDPKLLTAVRVRTQLRAEQSGRYLVGASGLGRFVLTIDGVEAFDVILELPEGADPVEGLMRPPQHGHEVQLSAGQVVELVLRHELSSSSASFDVSMLAFQLNVEPPDPGDDAAIAHAVDLAAAADVAVVVVGTTEEVESEGFDRDSLELPGRQDELVRRVAQANPRTVVVVNSGSPVLLPWREHVAAILLTWFPGQEFGNALADVLLGTVEPGGRLPTTWPADEDAPLPSTRPLDGEVVYSEGIHIGHRRFLAEKVEPAYWFGHGLGYTQWTIEHPEVAADGAGGATVTVQVTNSGRRPGREVVQVYAARPSSSVDRPVRWLAGFATVDAAPGEQVAVPIHLRSRGFEHWDVNAHDWVLEPGAFELHVARSAADLICSTSFDPSGQETQAMTASAKSLASTSDSPTEAKDYDALVASLDLPTKVRLLTGATAFTLSPEPSVDLCELRLSDGPTGVRGLKFSGGRTVALFPNATLLASAWSEDTAYEVGRMLAQEAMAQQIHVVLGPTINLHRSLLGGRLFEAYSEDPLLTGKLAAAYVRGMQDQRVAACLKHLVANESETLRNTVNSVVDDVTLRELYLLPFEIAVEESGAWSVMAAYNDVNGVAATEHDQVINGILKGEWLYDGLVMSDWYATKTAAAAANGGLDLVMPGPGGPWGDTLVQAVQDGEVDERVIDDHLRRLLVLADRVGALGEQRSYPDDLPAPDSSERKDQLRLLAAAGMTVLTNKAAALPLSKDARIALIGRHAVETIDMGGGSAHVNPPYESSVAEGLAAVLDTPPTVTDGVEVRDRAVAARSSFVTNPATGQPGIQALIYAADGRLIEERHEPAATTLVGFDDGFTETVDHVVLRARVDATGPVDIGPLGVGDWVVRHGSESRRLRLRSSGTGFGEEMLAPPGESVVVELDDSGIVELTARKPAPTGDGGTSPFASGSVGFYGLIARPARRSSDHVIADAVTAAAAADVAVVVVGLTEEQETEAVDKSTLQLPGDQDRMVSAVAAAAKRTIVVVNAATPVLMPWLDEVDAVLWAGLPGQEGGHAIAATLVGDQEPSGRLVTTFPAADGSTPAWSVTPVDGTLEYAEGTFIGYRGHYAKRAPAPVFWLGHGLGYARWEYSEARLVPDVLPPTIAVTVTNTGSRASREVVQVYFEPAEAEQPVRLVEWEAVVAEPGQSVEVTVATDERMWRRWDAAAATWDRLSAGGRLILARGLGDVRATVSL